MGTTYLRDLVMNEIAGYAGEQAAQFLDWLMQQGGDAFQSIPEQFKRRLGRNSWEDQRTSPNSSDVPEEQEMSRATYDLALHITGLFVLRRATHSPCELTSVC